MRLVKKFRALIAGLRNLGKIPDIHGAVVQLLQEQKELKARLSELSDSQKRHIDALDFAFEDLRREFFFLSSDAARWNPRSVRVVSDYSVARDSDDHKFPKGTIRDNTRHPRFVRKVADIFGRKVFVMDLGCAGGGLVTDFLIDGHFAIGIEGSDTSRCWGRAEWGIIPENLFTADITKRFEVVFNDSGLVKFDVITAWEVMEHIPESALPGLFQNIKNHLKPAGLFVGSIATFPDADPVTGAVYHVTIKPKEWWYRLAENAGFEVIHDIFDIKDFPRGSGNPRRSDWNEAEKPEMGFHITLRLAS